MRTPRPVRSHLLPLAVLALAALAAPARAAAPDSGALVADQRAVQRMDAAIARYRAIADKGGWAALPEGRTLRPGDSGAEVAALRRRLAATGDVRAGEADEASAFTPELDRAVRRFQTRHGLVADGLVGRATRAALNVPAAARAESLARNRERLAGLAARLPTSALVVNIPAYTLTLSSRGQVMLHGRVIVGKRSSPTPNFDGRIERIEINPYWNVPPSIARRELAPKIAADPSLPAREGIRVLSGPPGAAAEVPPGDVDWRRFAATGYRLRQDPGPDNPLGALKFVFPNPHDVFLHDTPTKAAFQRPARALSHGCVRVENAFTLAALLLGGNADWTEDRLRAAIATGATERVALARPMPLFLVYLTAWIDPDGTVEFRPDIYGRDAGPVPQRADKACTTGASPVAPG